MELPEYLRVLRRRWWLIALAVVVCVGGALLATMLQPRIYQSSLTLYLATAEGVAESDIPTAVASDRIATYSALAESPVVLELASRRIESGVALGHVSVTASKGESPIFMRLDVTADSADGAYAVARAYENIFPDYAADFQGFDSSGSPPVVVFESPEPPSLPVTPDVTLNILVGVGLGLALGIAGAFVIEAADRSVRTAAEAEALTGLNLLAGVPVASRDRAVAAGSVPPSSSAEAIRKLRTNVRFAWANNSLRSVAVTSAVGGEGKTTTAVDLAVMCAEGGQRVLLVDADLRHPAVASALGLESLVGLTNLLSDDLSVEDVVLQRTVGQELWVLPSGPMPANPSELLGSDRMQRLVRELSANYDIVIFDTPPVLPVADVSVLAQALDGVLVVTRLGSSRRDQLKRSVDALRHLDVRVLGLVCIGTPEDDGSYVPTPKRRRAAEKRRSKWPAASVSTSSIGAQHRG